MNEGKAKAKRGEKHEPDYQGAIKISTDASLTKMIAPGALVILSPLVAGFLFGPSAVEGLLAGIIVSGVHQAYQGQQEKYHTFQQLRKSKQ